MDNGLEQFWDYRVSGEYKAGNEVKGTVRLKRGFAQMLQGGVVMDVTSVEQACIAEKAGAVSVMVLDKLPADLRAVGGVARTAGIERILEIKKAVTIPVMAKCRIGHTLEAQVLQEAGVDMIDESEVLTPADYERHIWKWPFRVPFVCGCRDLGEALRRIEEGASMLRTKGEPGTGDVSEAVKHIRALKNDFEYAMRLYENKDAQQLIGFARKLNVNFDVLLEACRLRRLPVINFAAGGVVTPADAALLMSLGCDGIFVGSGIFKSSDPEKRARAIVLATTHWKDPAKVMEAQRMIEETASMIGQVAPSAPLKMQDRAT
ncbi:MAG: pyridoxal 5'-phosphate synthase lyase subunit PdxS [Thermoplasmata archaeon]